VILIDSDVLIGARTNGPLTISVVSIAELVGSMRSVERREVWRLLASFRAQPTTEIIARRAGEMMHRYRRSHSGIGLGDYLIAATADVKGLHLATLNVRHFPMFKNLRPPFATTAE
jgi:predicted nucleic acid-binding protein